MASSSVTREAWDEDKEKSDTHSPVMVPNIDGNFESDLPLYTWVTGPSAVMIIGLIFSSCCIKILKSDYLRLAITSVTTTTKTEYMERCILWGWTGAGIVAWMLEGRRGCVRRRREGMMDR